MQRKSSLATPLLVVMALCVPTDGLAQFRLLDAVKQKIEDKVEEAATRTLEGGEAQAADGGGASIVNRSFDFVPGDRVIYQDNLASSAPGRMPTSWKTDGSGEVVTLQGIPGQWLAMRESAHYKLGAPLDLPSRFTLEFDVVVAADKVKDLTTFTFGFAHDNSVASRNAGPINEVGLTYMNGDAGTVTSRATDYYHPFDFNYSGYVNRPMRVSIAVDGDQMKVYLDRTKIADTRLFRGEPSRHFFMEAPIRMENGGTLAVSNFRFATFN